MKYEIKDKKIFVFEYIKLIGLGRVWTPICYFATYNELQNSEYSLGWAELEALKVYKKIITGN